MSHLLENVRERCKLVAEQATFVSVDLPTLFLYPETLNISEGEGMKHDNYHYTSEIPEAVATYFLILDTINFGSGYFSEIFGPDAPSGYRKIASSLKNFLSVNGLLNAEDLRSMTLAKCTSILEFDLGNSAAVELATLMTNSLRELGEWMLQKYQGKAENLLADAKTAEELVSLMTSMPNYNDVSTHNGVQIPFYKRAQILVQDLVIALPNYRLLQFEDIENLTAFADNILPFVLRVDGILKCDPGLSHRIDSGVLIEAGSTEEIELRACAIHAIELLSEVISEDLILTSPRKLDYILWHRGQELKGQTRFRPHKTHSIYY